MWRADKIKHAARRSAWHNEPDDPAYSRYNPFGRMNTRVRTGVDEENGLRQVQSAPDASPVDTHGKSIDAGLAQHPHHSNTYPMSAEDAYAKETRGMESTERGAPSEKASSGQTPDTIPPSTIDGSAGPSSTDGKPRKRKLRAFLPLGKERTKRTRNSRG